MTGIIKTIIPIPEDPAFTGQIIDKKNKEGKKEEYYVQFKEHGSGET